MSRKQSDEPIENIVESIHSNLRRLNRRECGMMSDDEVESWAKMVNTIVKTTNDRHARPQLSDMDALLSNMCPTIRSHAPGGDLVETTEDGPSQPYEHRISEIARISAERARICDDNVRALQEALEDAKEELADAKTKFKADLAELRSNSDETLRQAILKARAKYDEQKEQYEAELAEREAWRLEHCAPRRLDSSTQYSPTTQLTPCTPCTPCTESGDFTREDVCAWDQNTREWCLGSKGVKSANELARLNKNADDLSCACYARHNVACKGSTFSTRCVSNDNLLPCTQFTDFRKTKKTHDGLSSDRYFKHGRISHTNHPVPDVTLAKVESQTKTATPASTPTPTRRPRVNTTASSPSESPKTRSKTAEAPQKANRER